MNDDKKAAAPKKTRTPAAPTAAKTPTTHVAKREPKQLPAIPRSSAVEDAKAALDAGAKALRDLAPTVVANLAKHIEAGRTDPNYEWSMKLVSERLLPARAIAAAGIRHLGGDATGGNSMPTVFINVVAASGPEQVPAAITVKALPDIEDEDPGNE
jgi:hypothetical protein